MTCDEVGARLDDYLDGGLAEEERRSVKAHLEGCAVCREKLAGLEALLADAARLPQSIMPERDLWQDIEPRLGKQGEVAATAAVGSRDRGSSRHWGHGRGWWLAAAAVLLMLLSSLLTMTWMRRATSPIVATSGADEYARASAELVRQVQAEERSLSPATLAVVQRNLAIIDAAIRESEDALARDPGNRGLQQMVLSRYGQRLDLLRQAVRAARES